MTRIINATVFGALLLLVGCVSGDNNVTNPGDIDNPDCQVDCGDIAVPIIAPDTDGTPIVNGKELEADASGNFTYWANEDEKLVINFQCPPDRLFSTRNSTASAGMNAIGWNQNGDTCQGGLAPNGTYVEPGDMIEYDVETSENAQGKIIMHGTNSWRIDVCITGNTFYGVDDIGDFVDGTISDDLNTIDVHLESPNVVEFDFTLVSL